MGPICSSKQKQKPSNIENTVGVSPSKMEDTSNLLKKRSSMKKMTFIQVSQSTIKDDVLSLYNLQTNVGKGSFGIVREGTEKSTGKKFAIKTLTKSQYPQDKMQFLQREIQIVSELNHESIIKCHRVFEDKNFVHFVFDFIEGGDLFDYIINQEDHHLNEIRTCQLFHQMLQALHYLSTINVIHRDIKLENFLLMQEDASLKLLLIDFGFALKLTDSDFATEKVGSLNYMSPEILQEKPYDHKTDIWSIGVVLYNMLSGKQPFSAEDEDVLLEKIINGEIDFSYEIWNQVSPDARNLISSLLSKNPDDRPSAFAALQHPWVLRHMKNSEDPTVAYTFKPAPDFINEIIQSLNKQTFLKNEVWNLILVYLENKEAESCKMYIKENNTFTNALSQFMINYEVFLNAILLNASNPVLKEKIKDILNKKLDQCRKQKLDYWETLNSFDRFKDAMMTEKIWNIFKNQDLNNEGIISIELASKIFMQNSIHHDVAKIEEFLISKNTKNTKKIDYENFAYLWKSK